MQTSSPENPEFKDLLKSNQIKTKDLSKEYEIKTKKLQELFKKYNSSKKNDNSLFKLIEKQFSECNEIGEKRMNLANESYFLIENEIKRINLLIEKLKFEHDNLESNSFSYNNYLINKNFEEIFSIGNNINSKRRSKGKKVLNDSEILSSLNPALNSKLKKKLKNKKFLKNKRLLNESFDESKKENVNEQNKKILENGELGTDWEDVTYKELDGKIGPKEPVYCFCNYISYGNMIKCDNPLCKREWFHFHCVGLRNQPKGKWFCSEKCAKEYLKKNKSERNFEKNKTKSKKKKKIK
jgi:hypothetical protein